MNTPIVTNTEPLVKGGRMFLLKRVQTLGRWDEPRYVATCLSYGLNPFVIQSQPATSKEVVEWLSARGADENICLEAQRRISGIPSSANCTLFLGSKPD